MFFMLSIASKGSKMSNGVMIRGGCYEHSWRLFVCRYEGTKGVSHILFGRKKRGKEP